MASPKPTMLLIGFTELLQEITVEAKLYFGPKTIFVPIAENRLTVQEVEKTIAENSSKVKAVLLFLPAGHLIYNSLTTISGSCCLGLFPYRKTNDIKQWLQGMHPKKTLKNKILITGMQKPFYEKWSRKIYDHLKQQHLKNVVQLKLPYTTLKEELAKEFAKGFALCVYSGHGRNRGWSGYRGFRWQDIEKEKMKAISGVVISLSCSSIRCDKKELPFGIQWVHSGRLGAFLGCKSPVRIQPLIPITNYFIGALGNKKNTTIAAVLSTVQKLVNRDTEEVQLAWKTFTLIGNPLQKIFADPPM